MGSPLPPDLSSQLGVRLFELHLDRRRSIQQERKRHRVGRKSRKQTAGKERAAIYQKRWCGAATSTRGRRGGERSLVGSTPRGALQEGWRSSVRSALACKAALLIKILSLFCLPSAQRVTNMLPMTSHAIQIMNIYCPDPKKPSFYRCYATAHWHRGS